MRSLLLCLLLVCSFFASACPNWSLDKRHPLQAWDAQLNSDGISLISDPQSRWGDAIQFSIDETMLWPNGQTRTELKHIGCNTADGSKTFIAWRFYLPNNIQTTNSIAYWESEKSYRQSLGLQLVPAANNQSTLQFLSRLPKNKIHTEQTLNPNQWYQLAMAITWSKDPNLGTVSVWLDGINIVDGIKVQTKPDTNEMFMQIGLHREKSEKVADVIYITDIKEAAKLSELMVN